MAEKPTVASLLRANERFYRVFESLDYEEMEALWEKSERVYCVHPGWGPLRGERPVMESWRRIIENTAAMRFELSQVEAQVEGDLGIVTVHEHIFTEVGQQRHSGAAVSTNIFAFDGENGEWRLFHHHASNTALPAEPEQGPLN